jgi:hypothetical protein
MVDLLSGQVGRQSHINDLRSILRILVFGFSNNHQKVADLSKPDQKRFYHHDAGDRGGALDAPD